jgi:hypothetical protein
MSLDLCAFNVRSIDLQFYLLSLRLDLYTLSLDLYTSYLEVKFQICIAALPFILDLYEQWRLMFKRDLFIFHKILKRYHCYALHLKFQHGIRAMGVKRAQEGKILSLRRSHSGNLFCRSENLRKRIGFLF